MPGHYARHIHRKTEVERQGHWAGCGSESSRFSFPCHPTLDTAEARDTECQEAQTKKSLEQPACFSHGARKHGFQCKQRDIALAFCHWDKVPDRIKERFLVTRDFIVSVHGQLAPWLWACGKAEHHGGEHTVEQSCSLHSDQEANRGGRKDPT
jgi:hypothetical protein